MKKSKFTKKELINYLAESGYKEISKNYWYKRINRTEYSYELKNWGYIYLERENPLREGWWREERKYKTSARKKKKNNKNNIKN